MELGCKLTVIVPENTKLTNMISVAKGDKLIVGLVSNLVGIMRTNAPRKSGALRRGIIPSSEAEHSASPWKTVYDVYMDPAMNSTFVKVAKSGKRYYYPASQEFGFLVKTQGQSTGMRRIPGKYFMESSFISFIPAAESAVESFVSSLEAIND